MKSGRNIGESEGGLDTQSNAPAPRLLSLQAAAAYCGLSAWTLRAFVIDGAVPVVRLPRPGRQQREDLRRVLIDRQDLDNWIDRHRVGRSVSPGGHTA